MPKYTDAQKQQWAEQRQQQLSAITDLLEQGVSEVFTSEKYMEYLKTMSKFTRYSTNNTILISMQRPEATLVAGYEAWKRNFNRQVKKGEKGIKIFAPVPYKRTIERDKIDPSTRQPVVDQNGDTVKEQVEVRRAAFRAITVFDVSQTTGDPLPLLSPTLLRNDVADFENVRSALVQVAKIPVRFEDIPGEAFGYYDRSNKWIVVRDGLAQAQTVKTLIHEIAHSRLHAIDENDPDSDKHLPDQNTREVQAESVAFVVASHYGLDTGEYSFTYIAGWSSGRETDELKASLQTIRETANDLITEIDERLLEQEKEQNVTVEDELEPEPEEELPEAVDFDAPKPTNLSAPEKIPFYNVSYEEAVNDPSIGRQGYFASRKETMRCAFEMEGGLGMAYHNRELRPFLEKMVQEFGAERVNLVLACTIRSRPEDGRFHKTARDAAAQVAIPTQGDRPDYNRIMDFTLNAHSVIVDVAMETFLELERAPGAVERSVMERCAEKLEDGLRTAYENGKLSDFLKEKVQEFGQEQVKDVLALTVNYRSKANPQTFDDATKQAVAGMYVKVPRDANFKNCLLYTEPVIVGAAVKACFQPEQRRENIRQDNRQKKPSIRQRLRRSQQAKQNAPAREQEQKRGKKHDVSL